MRSSKHPKALSYLFLTEMWERFGFYTMQGLLILFMTEYFHFSDDKSYTLLGMITALLYISPIIGGILADKTLGFKYSIYVGCIFLILGYILLSLASTEFIFNIALATIILGNGFFKPNISSMLGLQYANDQANRDAGFTIFYIGINLGAGLAGITSGYIKELFGWHWCFILSSVGITIGLITFIVGLKHIKLTTHPTISTAVLIRFTIICILSLICIYLLINSYNVADWLLPCIGIVFSIYLITLSFQQEAAYRKNMMLLNILIFSSVIFWMLYWQMFFSINLFIERLVNRNIGGVHLSTTLFYASESIYILLLGPIFAWLWNYLDRYQLNPSTYSKFIIAILCTGFSMLILSLCTLHLDQQGLINPLIIFSAYLLITIGELFLSPIGLSAVTQLAPPHLAGTMMGVWFVATGFGGLLAGVIAKFAAVPLRLVTTEQILGIYQQAFFKDACIAFGTVLVLLIIKIRVKYLHAG